PDKRKVRKPRWHFRPRGHSDIAIGGDFQEVAILSDYAAAHAGQRSPRISREADPLRVRFEPPHMGRYTSDEQNKHDHRNGRNRKRQSSENQTAAGIFSARIHDVTARISTPGRLRKRE